MGSSASTNSQRSMALFSSDGRCNKHGQRVYTHFCEETKQLMCLTCFQDYRRAKVRRGNVSCTEVKEYVQSYSFKQKQIKASESLRKTRRTLNEEVNVMETHCNKLRKTGREITERVTSYVDNITKLLEHLAEDLCRQSQKLVLTETDGITAQIEDVKRDMSNIDRMIAKLSKLNSSKPNVFGPEIYLANVVKADTYLSEVRTGRYQLEQTHVDLSLNKSLRLEEIVKATKASPATLGRVQVRKENHKEVKASDTISVVSEESQIHVEEIKDPLAATDSGSTRQREQARKDQITKSASQELSVDAVDTSSHSDSLAGHPEQDVVPPLPRVQSTGLERRRLSLQPRSSTPSASRATRQDVQNLRHTKSAMSLVSPLSPTTPSGVVLVTTPRPAPPLSTRQPVLVQRITLPRDQTTCNITGSVFLPDGSLLLVDQKNRKLKLFDHHFRLLDELGLHGEPHNAALDATSTSGSRVAITLPASHLIKLIDVRSGKLTAGPDSIHTGPQCWGVEFLSRSLAYSTEKDAVFHQEDQGFVKFPYSFSEPVSLCTDRQNKVLFVSCNGLKSYSGCVVAIDFSGKIKFTYSSKDLKHPVCSAIDQEGNVYVVDREPHSIHQITADGMSGRVLLEARHGSFQHLQFFPHRDVFLVSEKDSDLITLYEMR